MPKTIFTTITPLPAGVGREVVLETLHDHLEMIDLNPTHSSRNRINPPPEASPEEYHCTWYQITDDISYLPGVKGKVSFKACFHDLSNGLQNHVYAPMGLDIKEKWTLGGNAPGEPIQPAEIGIGAPVSGLYLREDVEMKCNFLMTRFVKKQLKDALATLVARLLVKAQLQEAAAENRRLQYSPMSPAFSVTAPGTPPLSPPLTGGFPGYKPNANRFSTQTAISEMEGSGRSTKSQYSPVFPPPPGSKRNSKNTPNYFEGYPPPPARQPSGINHGPVELPT